MVDVTTSKDKHYLREDKLLDPLFGVRIRCDEGITATHIRRALEDLAKVKDLRARVAEHFLTKLKNGSYDQLRLPLVDGTINIWDKDALLVSLKHTHKVVSVGVDVATKTVKVTETIRTGKSINYNFNL